MKEIINKVTNKEDLTVEEMRRAMNLIMNGEATSCQIGAVLMGLRIKGETLNEIIGAVKGMRDNMITLDLTDEYLIDTCGTGGDGGRTFNISTAVSIIAAAAGVKVAKHGNRAVSSRSGSADVLEALGIETNLSPTQSKEQLIKSNMSFLFAPQYHKAMKNVSLERRELGVRTIFNLIGPLANPAPIKGQLVGIFDGNLVEKVGNVLLNLGIERGLVVHGNDGLDEITITANTKVCEVNNGKILTYEINPEDLGINKTTIDEIRGGSATDNAEIIINILRGKKDAKRDIVILNSAAALYVGKKVNTLREGIELAQEIVDSGRALNKYKELTVREVVCI